MRVLSSEEYQTKLPHREVTTKNYIIEKKVLPAGQPLQMMSPSNHCYFNEDVTFTILRRNGGFRDIVMSDTPREVKTQQGVVRVSRGDVLIAGLGLGWIVFELLKKKRIIKSITVVEIDKEIIDLTSKYIKDKRVRIVNADIYKYKPDMKFDYIYIDIWDNICSDNLDDMRELRNKLRDSLKEKDGVKYGNIDCWAEKLCIQQLSRSGGDFT